ncbi:zinc-binding alcohol dehydrogenase family protein [Kribbella orskensis]|uniref:Zinc-binding alcohol dehydrogenase family protein n=1 Tax=Kribbella orskensis TaxID=2512216 RepID=A0ABY2BIK5_9ACTN|nr:MULTISPECIES: alcohol dehydrogenase catalytic domain-containing protein [Kribbella]TCN39119.1 zinc-binding alcohol dehydrogenase family protein [Kribbella sp. VKM Ac-2500]TCO21766.1 zinc-binding alcohol dehydrogenase family protein [Kribbella orskensis]
MGRGAGVKAVVYDRYGSPDVLQVEDVPVPSPAAGQVRVKIAATSVNLSDWECLRGSPAYARIGGLRVPARRTLGSDIAGLVDDVGERVTRFRPGDEVYGDNLTLMGGFAEYALAPESALAHKIRIHIHRSFALDEVPAALAHVGEGRALGKVVVCLS